MNEAAGFSPRSLGSDPPTWGKRVSGSVMGCRSFEERPALTSWQRSARRSCGLFQAFGEAVGPVANRARAEADDHVAGLRLLAHQPLEIVLVADRAGVAVAVTDQPRDEVVAARPLDRVLAGRVDRRHDHRVGIVEAGGKIVKQAFKACEAVRLGNSDYPVSSGSGGQFGAASATAGPSRP